MAEADKENRNTGSPIEIEPVIAGDDVDGDTPRLAIGVSVYHTLILFGAIGGALCFERHFGIEWQDIVKQVYALMFGALGGTFAASRYVILSVRHNAYQRKRLLWQILTPIYSAALAWVGTISVAGGILTLASSPKPSEPQFTFFVMGFSFLVGFASESFSKRLIMAAQTLFGEHAPLEEITGKSPKGKAKGTPTRTESK